MSTDKRNISRQDLRVLRKNMVYCSGLPSNLTKDQLSSSSYFGLYGKVEKVVINVFPNRNYCSVYLTYSHEFQAATAILACNEYCINKSTLWCLFGTMKYCKYFLKKIQCKNKQSCPYVHVYDYKNEVQIQNSPAEAYPEHEQLAKQVIRIYPERIAEMKRQKKQGAQLPEPLEALYFMEQSQDEIAQQVDEKRKQLGAPGLTQAQKQIEKGISQKSKTGNSIRNQEQQEIIDLQAQIKKLILKQLQRVKGSRIMDDIKHQEKSVRQIILAGLSD